MVVGLKYEDKFRGGNCGERGINESVNNEKGRS